MGRAAAVASSMINRSSIRFHRCGVMVIADHGGIEPEIQGVRESIEQGVAGIDEFPDQVNRVWPIRCQRWEESKQRSKGRSGRRRVVEPHRR